jgi:hypothetical protein
MATRLECQDGVAQCECGLRLECTNAVFHNCKKPRRRGLGDVVADVLSAVGITEDRVSGLLGADCGCRRRREQLNAATARLFGGQKAGKRP